jgi:hypothetical protein
VKNSISNQNPLTDHDIMMSPSSMRSGYTDNKKESVQVFVRVRPPFSHEVDEDASHHSYYYPPVEMDSQ